MLKYKPTLHVDELSTDLTLLKFFEIYRNFFYKNE
jgi:hypothetical protein